MTEKKCCEKCECSCPIDKRVCDGCANHLCPCHKKIKCDCGFSDKGHTGLCSAFSQKSFLKKKECCDKCSAIDKIRRRYCAKENCPCHQVAPSRCPECQFEPANGHSFKCSYYKPQTVVYSPEKKGVNHIKGCNFVCTHGKKCLNWNKHSCSCPPEENWFRHYRI